MSSEEAAANRSCDPAVGFIAVDEPGGGRAHLELLRTGLLRPSHLHLIPRHRRSVAQVVKAIVGARRDRSLRHADILHAHGVRAAALTLCSGVTLSRPLVVTVHGLHAARRSQGVRRLAALSLTAMVLRMAGKVLFVGQSDLDLAVDLRLVSRAKAVRIPPLFETPSARPIRRMQEPVQVVWAGRMETEKDPLLFLDAVEMIRQGARARFLMIGEGALRATVLAHPAVRSGAVSVLPWQDDLWSSASSGDIYVSTSRWEGLPLTACEAASAGLAVVATDVAGNKDLAQEGVPIILVDREAKNLSVAIVELLENPERAHRLGRDARKAVATTYRSEDAIEVVTRVYREVARATA